VFSMLIQPLFFLMLFFVLTPDVCDGAFAAEESLRALFIKEIEKTKSIVNPRSLRIIIHSNQNISKGAASSMYSAEQIKKIKKQGKDPFKLKGVKEYAYHKNLVLKKEYHNGTSYIIAKNERYVFGISKEDGTEDYVLNFLEISNSNKKVDERIEKEVNNARALLRLPWNLFGHHLADWLQKEHFIILNVTEVVKDDKKMVRIDFEHVVTDIRPGNLSLTDAYVICDPEAHWAIKERSVVYNNAKGEKVTTGTDYFEIEKLEDGFPVVVKNISSTEFIGKKDEKIVNVFEYEIKEDVAKEEFYLSSYGLPEPNFEEPFLSTWMKYLLAGLVCLGIAYWIKRRRAVA